MVLKSELSTRLKVAFAVVFLAVYGFHPAPPNSESPILVGVLQTVFRHFVTCGIALGLKWNCLPAFRGAFDIASSPPDERVHHEIIRRPNYDLHLFRPVYLDVEFASKSSAAIIYIHGGGWTIGNVAMNYNFGSQNLFSIITKLNTQM